MVEGTQYRLKKRPHITAQLTLIKLAGGGKQALVHVPIVTTH
jgi:hypothetical protein